MKSYCKKKQAAPRNRLCPIFLAPALGSNYARNWPDGALLTFLKESLSTIVVQMHYEENLLNNQNNRQQQLYSELVKIVNTYGALFAKPTSFLHYLFDFCYTLNFSLLGCSYLLGERKKFKSQFFFRFSLATFKDS